MNQESIGSLTGFDPLISDWFAAAFGTPTPIQDLAWPVISRGEHALFTAPTGSGKTLTAFLWAINQLATGAWPAGQLAVVYVSPLKALNNDIRVNLRDPLREIHARFEAAGRPFPQIEVFTRSGDTPQRDRQRMVRHPPEILITTPESLNLILSSTRARHVLLTVKSVILDEIHAVLDGKRGTHLITAVERIALLAGEFQRIAVSATVKPLDVVAGFVGGYRKTGAGFEKRTVTTIQAPGSKKIDLTVTFPTPGDGGGPGAGADGGGTDDTPTIWPELVRRLHAIIDRNKSTLVFVTSRRDAEKITGYLNEGQEDPIAYAHHGSLSREIRSYVETALKAGRLKAIVATNSLELGIDIGELDEIVMVKTPFSISSALQRIGRAGHRVDLTSRGVLIAAFGRDAIDAAVVSRAALAQDIEPTRPVQGPLDVLAQQIISMTAVEVWDIDELFAAVRCSWPFHSLNRTTFTLVIEMLAGRYADTRIRDLKPRIIVDAIDNTVKARDGALTVLYQSGGTIPDRGYYTLRLAGDGGRIGELDEEFVWERRVGETFFLGSQLWTIRSISDRDVEVSPGKPGNHVIPFWKAEARGRGIHQSMLTMEFLEEAEDAVSAGTLDRLLEQRPELSPEIRDVIAQTLHQQREMTGLPLPHRHHIIMENYLRPLEGPRKNARGGDRAGSDSSDLIIHCPWGSGVTQPLAMALAAQWQETHDTPLETFADNNCLVVILPPESAPGDIISERTCRDMLTSGRLEALLRISLEHSGLFGAMFRENAGRALLLPRGGFDRRMPLWLNRLKSKKLLGAVERFDDFPILLETWRSCLEDRFDMPSLRLLLDEIASGLIQVSSCETTSPSPFATDVVWRQTNLYMYLDDSRPGGTGSALREDLIKLAANNETLRPEIPEELVAELERRLQRVEPGYSPEDGGELVDWVQERLVLTAAQAADLALAMIRDRAAEAHTPAGRQISRDAAHRLCWIMPGGASPLLAAVDRLATIQTILPNLNADAVFPVDPDAWATPPDESSAGSAAFTEAVDRFLSGPASAAAAQATLSQIVRFYGPKPAAFFADMLGEEARIDDAVEDLVGAGTLLAGRFTNGCVSDQLCDAENLERLLSMLRRSHRPVFEPVSGRRLPLLWAELTGLARQEGEPEDLVDILDVLFAYPAPVRLWESDIFPARIPNYYPIWMDGLFKESPLEWRGCGRERVTFALADDLPLVPPRGETDDVLANRVVDALRNHGPQDLLTLSAAMGETTEDVTEALWTAAWAGMASNDSFHAVRTGALSGFTPQKVAGPPGVRSWPGRKRPSRRNWAATRPIAGKWFAAGEATSSEREDADPTGVGADAGSIDSAADPIQDLENAKERARLVLLRYGVVFRQLLDRELPEFRWGRLFRALRIMELSGEVVAGAFVTGVSGLQFAAPSALRHLENAAAPIIWMNAADPASPCGLPFPGIWESLPARIPSNHLVFRGTQLALVSKRHGSELVIDVAPDDPDLKEMLAPVRSMISRRWNPRSRVAVETINETPALESPFAQPLQALGFRRDYRALILTAGYR